MPPGGWMLPGIFLSYRKVLRLSYKTKKPFGQDRTAAERNYVAESNPPQAENPAKQDSFSKKYGRKLWER